jgi:hypothetical protein
MKTIQKKISYFLLPVAFFLLVPNHGRSQGYAVFGTSNQSSCSCSEKGICMIEKNPFMYQNFNATDVSFNTSNNVDNSMCTVDMTVDMTALYNSEPLQFNYLSFASDNYVFGNTVEIPAYVLGGDYFQSHPNAYIAIPAGTVVRVPQTSFPVPVSYYKTITLGTFPISGNQLTTYR